MMWKVILSRKATKQFAKLPERVRVVMRLLLAELEMHGPVLKDWPNYGILRGTKKGIKQYHCHLIKGNPTYVCCWELIDQSSKAIEVYYVGTHEKAPY